MNDTLRAVHDAASKIALFQAALHLAAVSTGEYETALADGRALERLLEELDNLAAAGIVRVETAAAARRAAKRAQP
jgi:predicted transcriptional regulator